MPTKPKKPCATPRCSGLTDGQYCDRCRRKAEARRGSAAQRGYGAEHRAWREEILSLDPYCWDSFKRHTQPVVSTVADHIIPRSDGGESTDENGMGLCVSCHNRKTALEGMTGRLIPVTLVCGPPGSGKTSYVRQRMQRGDLVIDMDALFSALSGRERYDKPKELLAFAASARDAVLHRIRRGGNVRHAWVIMSGATREDRERTQRRFARCDLVILDVPLEQCLKRLRADKERQHQAQWEYLARRWWDEYEPQEGRAHAISMGS